MSAQPAIQNDEWAEDDSQTAVVGSNGQYVTFGCDEKAYGIDIMAVREIRSWSPTTELPDQPRGACGVLDIRGEIVQVFDLKALLGSGRTEVTSGHVVLVVSVDGRDTGILVDSVSDIIQVEENDMRAPPGREGADSNPLVCGLAKREDDIVAILDLTKLLSHSSY